MSEVVLGTLPSSSSDRDAIHVAVIPMQASEMLRPGQRVGLVSPSLAGPSSEILGIVDPYLTDVVPKGGMFWLCLLPGTVQGMRHHWQHSSFGEKSAKDSANSVAPVSEKEASEAWLRNAADRLGVSYDTLVAEYSDLSTGDYINNGEYIRDIWYEIEDEFWRHHKIVTGREVPERNRGGFTCSC